MKFDSGLLLDKISSGIILLDSNQVVREINQTAASILGSSPTEALNRPLLDIPDHQLDLFHTIQAVLEDLSGKEQKSILVTAGDKEVFELHISIIQGGSSQDHLHLLEFRDVSRRMQAEKNLAITRENMTVVLDTLKDYYFETDLRGVITNINKAFCDHLGYSRKEELLGKHFRHFTDRESARQVFLNFSRLFEMGKVAELFKYSYHTKDGISHVGEITFSPVFENGNLIGARGVVRDITDREKAVEMLNHAKADAEARAEELAALNRIVTLSNQSLNLDNTLKFLCMELTHIFPVRNAAIALITHDHSSMEVVAFHSLDPREGTAQGTILPLKGNPILEEVIRQKRPIVLQDPESDRRIGLRVDPSMKTGMTPILFAPLLIRGDVIGAIRLPARDLHFVFNERQLKLAETIANHISTSVDNAQLFASTRNAREIAESDLEIGHQIQSDFLPGRVPQIPGWEIATHFEGARQVAGDFYDFFPIPNSRMVACVIADVCDKGVGAALFMVLSRTLLRAFSQNEIVDGNVGTWLKTVILNTNEYITRIHENANMFATVFFGVFDPDSGDLYYINAGHEPPVILNEAGRILYRLKPTGPVVGLFPGVDFRVEHMLINKGDFLVSFTDGVVDARNRQGMSFTEERFLKYIQSPWTSLFSMLFELKVELTNHMGGEKQYDDITMLSIRRKQTSDREQHAICRVAGMDTMAELKDFVLQAAKEYELDHERSLAFEMTMENSCRNIIEHGFDGQSAGLISLTFERDRDKARLIIRDDGKYLDPGHFDSFNPDAGLKNMEAGGGDFNSTNRWMDRISYARMNGSGNELILEQDLNLNQP